MLTICERGSASSGVNRRELLRIRTLGLGGLSLPGLITPRTNRHTGGGGRTRHGQRQGQSLWANECGWPGV